MFAPFLARFDLAKLVHRAQLPGTRAIPAASSALSFLEAVKFFHLNALFSPILTKIHFDVLMTAIADTLYTMLAQKLRGFEDCDAPKLYRNFIRGKGRITVRKKHVTVSFPRRAHNPILRGVPWQRLPATIPGLPGARLELEFK